MELGQFVSDGEFGEALGIARVKAAGGVCVLAERPKEAVGVDFAEAVLENRVAIGVVVCEVVIFAPDSGAAEKFRVAFG